MGAGQDGLRPAVCPHHGLVPGHDQMGCQGGGWGEGGGEEINNIPLYFRVVIFFGDSRTQWGEEGDILPSLPVYQDTSYQVYQFTKFTCLPSYQLIIRDVHKKYVLRHFE